MIWVLILAWIIWTILFLFINFWLKNRKGVSNNSIIDSLDIIIAVRNEGEKIEHCIKSIDDQAWLPDNCRVIIVNDHSEDNTLQKAQSLRPQKIDLDVIDLTHGSGKKDALQYALDRVTSSTIVQIDGDCWMHPDFLQALLSGVEPSSSNSIFGEIRIKGNSFFEQLQMYEGLNNQCTTEAFVTAQLPIMASGGAMAMTGEAIPIYRQSLSKEMASGDDIFFAHMLAQKGISYTYKPDAIVYSHAEQSLVELIRQRTRWSAKTSSYDWWFPKAIALLVFGINLIFLGFLLLLPFVQGVFWVALLWTLKFIVEFSFHRYWFSGRGVRYPIHFAMALTVLYPIYVVFIGIRSILMPRTVWKGRPV